MSTTTVTTVTTVPARHVQVVVAGEVIAEAMVSKLPIKAVITATRREYGLAPQESVLVRTVREANVPAVLADRLAFRARGKGLAMDRRNRA